MAHTEQTERCGDFLCHCVLTCAAQILQNDCNRKSRRNTIQQINSVLDFLNRIMPPFLKKKKTKSGQKAYIKMKPTE